MLFGLTRARRRLRLPADATRDLRAHPPREDQRRHLPRDDEEDSGRRLPHRRSAGAPLSPRVRQVAVLQLPPRRSGPASTCCGCGSRSSSGASTGAPATREARPIAAIASPELRPPVTRRLPRVLPRPPRDDHRRPRVHRQQPRAPARRARRRRAARRFADPRLRRQPVQHRRHRRSRARQRRRRASAERR